jgi:hypothetical protein
MRNSRRVKFRDRLTDEFGGAERERRFCDTTVVHVIWQIHEVNVLVEGAVRLSVKEKTAIDLAAIDLVKPLRPLLVEYGFDAASTELYAFVLLGVDVGTLWMALAEVVGELINADLRGLGLSLNTNSKSRKSAEQNRNKTHHDV